MSKPERREPPRHHEIKDFLSAWLERIQNDAPEGRIDSPVKGGKRWIGSKGLHYINKLRAIAHLAASTRECDESRRDYRAASLSDLLDRLSKSVGRTKADKPSWFQLIAARLLKTLRPPSFSQGTSKNSYTLYLKEAVIAGVHENMPTSLQQPAPDEYIRGCEADLKKPHKGVRPDVSWAAGFFSSSSGSASIGSSESAPMTSTKTRRLPGPAPALGEAGVASSTAKAFRSRGGSAGVEHDNSGSSSSSSSQGSPASGMAPMPMRQLRPGHHQLGRGTAATSRAYGTNGTSAPAESKLDHISQYHHNRVRQQHRGGSQTSQLPELAGLLSQSSTHAITTASASSYATHEYHSDGFSEERSLGQGNHGDTQIKPPGSGGAYSMDRSDSSESHRTGLTTRTYEERMDYGQVHDVGAGPDAAGVSRSDRNRGRVSEGPLPGSHAAVANNIAEVHDATQPLHVLDGSKGDTGIAIAYLGRSASSESNDSSGSGVSGCSLPENPLDSAGNHSSSGPVLQIPRSYYPPGSWDSSRTIQSVPSARALELYSHESGSHSGQPLAATQLARDGTRSGNAGTARVAGDGGASSSSAGAAGVAGDGSARPGSAGAAGVAGDGGARPGNAGAAGVAGDGGARPGSAGASGVAGDGGARSGNERLGSKRLASPRDSADGKPPQGEARFGEYEASLGKKRRVG